jgi:hypothetical protein
VTSRGGRSSLTTSDDSSILTASLIDSSFISENSKVVYDGRYLTRLVGEDNLFRTKHIGIANKRKIYTRDLFNTLVDLPWRKLIIVFVLWYLLWYFAFAAVYAYLLPNNCIDWNAPKQPHGFLFSKAFMFSVETMSTIGFGEYQVRGPLLQTDPFPPHRPPPHRPHHTRSRWTAPEPL